MIRDELVSHRCPKGRKGYPLMRRFWKIGLAITGVLVVVALIVTGALAEFTTPSISSDKVTPSASASPAPSASPTAEAVACDAKFVQTPLDRGAQNRYIVNGVVTLKLDPSTPAIEKRDAYLAAAGHDVVLLGAYAYASGLWADPNDTTPLLSGSCLSPKGQEVHTMLVGAWTSNGSTSENTPTPNDGTNSGIDSGKMVVASTPGMQSGRTGTRITFANGSSIFIDDRCGNLVFTGTPSIPKGPTDQPPPPPTTPTCPTGQVGVPPNCLEKKVPSQGPAPRGNAPVGGGKNADPGPGVYVPPAQMVHPPATPVAPAPPAPAASTPPVASTPDPAPAPPPEVSAPPASDPATGCSPPPGMTTC